MATLMEWIEEQEALCKAATPGPWEFTYIVDDEDKEKLDTDASLTFAEMENVALTLQLDSETANRCVMRLKPCDTPQPLTFEDADFLMQARTSLPQALAIIKAACEWAIGQGREGDPMLDKMHAALNAKPGKEPV